MFDSPDRMTTDGDVHYSVDALKDLGDRGPSMDVFSFGLLLYEIILGRSLVNAADALLGGKALRDLVGKVKYQAPPRDIKICGLAEDLIVACLAEGAGNRPTFQQILEVMRENEFQILPNVDIAEVRAFEFWVEEKKRPVIV
jgi:hypothetical protein